MDQMGKWVPAHVPLDEGYWEALLCGENGLRGQAATPPGEGEVPEVAETSEAVQRSDSEPGVDWWEEAERLMAAGAVLDVPVVGCNRGGVLVGWNGLRGFVPASHLVRNFSPHASEAERQEELRRLIGTRLSLKILELDRHEARFVLSERAAGVDGDRRRNVLDELSPGDICHGRVTNLCSFGAFVDLDGIEGLVHISELSWGRIDHPEDVLEVGQPIDVYVLNVDRARERIGLSVKRLEPDPWASVEDRYEPGQVVEGVVTRVVGFGAFVRVEDGLEGLVHVSELAYGPVAHPRDVVQEGDEIAVRVLNVDGRQRRMGLSLRHIGQVGVGDATAGGSDVMWRGSAG
jgi:small subunit ribosomal protein S1